MTQNRKKITICPDIYLVTSFDCRFLPSSDSDSDRRRHSFRLIHPSHHNSQSSSHMTNESREQILADFQSVTGLENINECIQILDHHNWNLQIAVHQLFDGNGINHDQEPIVPIITTPTNLSSVEPKPMKRQQTSDDDDGTDYVQIINTVPAHASTMPKPKARDLDFTIEYLDQTVKVKISDQNTVQQLRKKISELLKIPEHEQNFLNWRDKSYDDRTLLKDLHFPAENTIRLSATSNGIANRPTTSAFREFHMQTGGDFTLTIQFEDKTGHLKPISLLLKSNSTIREMKEKVEQCTNVPVEQQVWPNLHGTQDHAQLSESRINHQSKLLVREQQTTTGSRDIKRTIVRSNTDDESMIVDNDIVIDDDDDDDTTVPIGQTSTVAGVKITDRDALIPEACTNDEDALEHFSRVFHRRYGSTGPVLYMGSLDDAIQKSLYESIDKRRPLAIYLHNDQSVCANVFCSQVLSSESIIEYLLNNYMVWAWDVTMDSNRQRLLETLRRCVGTQGAQRIDEMDSDEFPVLLILTRTRGTLELMDIIQGKSTLNEALMSLIHSHESFDQQRRRDAEEETVREQREQLKRQQEDEYHRSLAADLEKERQKQDDQRKQKEEQDEQEKKQQLRLKQQRECQERLPEEPHETEKNITRFKIRLPDDEGVLMRRFRAGDHLQTLFDYLTSQGRMFGEYKLLTTFPKLDLTSLNHSDTFEQLKLCPQAQLFLESI